MAPALRYLETWALFIDLVKAFDSVPRGALWAILSKFGFPHHFINLVVRLHTNAKVEFTIGDTESEVESLIGVRQGSCEGPHPLPLHHPGCPRDHGLACRET